jgi:hypothetical protein
MSAHVAGDAMINTEGLTGVFLRAYEADAKDMRAKNTEALAKVELLTSNADDAKQRHAAVVEALTHEFERLQTDYDEMLANASAPPARFSLLCFPRRGRLWASYRNFRFHCCCWAIEYSHAPTDS